MNSSDSLAGSLGPQQPALSTGCRNRFGILPRATINRDDTRETIRRSADAASICAAALVPSGLARRRIEPRRVWRREFARSFLPVPCGLCGLCRKTASPRRRKNHEPSGSGSHGEVGVLASGHQLISQSLSAIRRNTLEQSALADACPVLTDQADLALRAVCVRCQRLNHSVRRGAHRAVEVIDRKDHHGAQIAVVDRAPTRHDDRHSCSLDDVGRLVEEVQSLPFPRPPAGEPLPKDEATRAVKTHEKLPSGMVGPSGTELEVAVRATERVSQHTRTQSTEPEEHLPREDGSRAATPKA